MTLPLKYKDRREEGQTPLRQCQLAQLHLLHVVDAICKKHNIKYVLDGGTLLGAVRHNGFIPWDDDLDVGMMRKDYYRFLKIARQELPEDAILVTPNDVPERVIAFSKLRDAYSFYGEMSRGVSLSRPNGIFIDIFPYEQIPNLGFIERRVVMACKWLWHYARALRCSGGRGWFWALFGGWLAHSLIESCAVKNCLLLAGDIPTRCASKANRKTAPVFGDAASATFLVRTEDERLSHFVMGTDGTGWDKLIKPFGGMRLPFTKDVFDLSATDALGNVWTAEQSMMQGEEVFAFTMNVAPQLIRDCLSAAKWTNDNVDLFAVHQANKQILEMIVSKAGIPMKKTPTDVFSKYANSSTNSVVTVLCDQPTNRILGKVVLCTFGIGLSWGGAAISLADCHNGGITTYNPPAARPTRQEQIEHWLQRFREG